MFTHTVTRSVSGGSTPVGASFQLSAGAEHNIDESIPFGSTNLPVAFAVVAAKLVSVALLSTANDITVKTNSSSSPINTFNLKKGIPIIWTNQDGPGARDSNNVALADITSFFVTNASVDTDSVLQIRALVDPT